MAFSGDFVCSSFKQDLLAGQHNFSTANSGNTFKMSLYTNTATGMDASRTGYNVPAVSGECPATGTYTTNGKFLGIPASMPSLTTTVAWTDFDDLTWAAFDHYRPRRADLQRRCHHAGCRPVDRDSGLRLRQDLQRQATSWSSSRPRTQLARLSALPRRCDGHC